MRLIGIFTSNRGIGAEIRSLAAECANSTINDHVFRETSGKPVCCDGVADRCAPLSRLACN